MNDTFGFECTGGSCDCRANGDRALCHCFLLDDCSTFVLDCACNTGTHPKVIVGRVDDCIRFLISNVTKAHSDFAFADMDLHGENSMKSEKGLGFIVLKGESARTVTPGGECESWYLCPSHYQSRSCRYGHR